MNERIRLLAEQCHHRYSEHNIDLEKFAELILVEVTDILSTYRGKMVVFDEPDYLLNILLLRLKNISE